MKKIILVVAIVAVVAGTAFANHPGGLGIGFGWQGGRDFTGNTIWNNNLTVFLKAPVLPAYFGFSFRLNSDTLTLGLTADLYMLDMTLIPSVNFGLFLGPGLYADFATSDWGTGISAGGRLPIGVYIIPVKFLEVFLDIAPRVGLKLTLPKDGDMNFDFGGGFAADFGVRFWI